jgi:hypothetical protein
MRLILRRASKVAQADLSDDGLRFSSVTIQAQRLFHPRFAFRKIRCPKGDAGVDYVRTTLTHRIGSLQELDSICRERISGGCRHAYVIWGQHSEAP